MSSVRRLRCVVLCAEVEVCCCPLPVPPAEDMRLSGAVFKWPDSLLTVLEKSKTSLASSSRQAEDSVTKR